ncbi:hypothetical protein J4474_02525, partial [Candidatus Pacearchaeota archaeon]|nr:hypothetical protein [Candidatus Pacearchaeota archaeon]
SSEDITDFYNEYVKHLTPILKGRDITPEELATQQLARSLFRQDVSREIRSIWFDSLPHLAGYKLFHAFLDQRRNPGSRNPYSSIIPQLEKPISVDEIETATSVSNREGTQEGIKYLEKKGVFPLPLSPRNYVCQLEQITHPWQF